MYPQQRSLLDLRPSVEFSDKICRFLRSLADFLLALAFLCCHCIECLTHMLPVLLLALTLYMCTSIYINLFCVYSFEP